MWRGGTPPSAVAFSLLQKIKEKRQGPLRGKYLVSANREKRNHCSMLAP